MEKTIILITGANQGLGLEVAKRLSTTGQDLHIIIAGRSMPKITAAVESLEPIKVSDIHRLVSILSHTYTSPQDSTNTLQGLQLDVTVDTSIKAAVQKMETDHGRLDVLMNNAGIASPAQECSLRDSYANVFDTNVFGPAVLTDACIPLLKKSPNPRIVFMSSGLGSISDTLDPKYEFYGIENPAYKASKAALNMLTAHYAVKYGKESFQVNTCDPGFRKTNLNRHAAMAGDAAEGAINACRLIMLGKEGENGTFSDLKGLLRW